MGLIRSGMEYSSLQQRPLQNLQLEMVSGGLSDMRSQQMSMPTFQPQKMETVPCSSNTVSLQVPVSSYQLPLPHPRVDGFISHNLNQSNMLMVQTEQQMLHKVQGQTIAFQNQPREAGSMFKLPQPSILSKRKATEIATENFKLQQLTAMNKRMIPEEHRPWLQSQLSKHLANLPNNTAVPLRNAPLVPPKKYPSTAASLQPQPVKRPVPPRAGQVASSPKESFESVRSKLRESLSSALALAAQSKETGPNNSDSTYSIAVEKQENSQTVDVTNNRSSETDESKEAIKVMEENSGQTSGESSAGAPAALASSNKGFQPNISLSEDDVTFSDSLFVKDELLQGNGLSWVMESDVMLTDKKIIDTAVSQDLTNGDIGCGDSSARVLETPETLAYKIEAELYKLFGGVNKKYKEKGRSLLFNLKDRSNPELGERVLSGEISPERLCSMTAEELASKELSQWRIAKAEELAQMVVLPDTGVDIRRLVKKTHKGEFQVELEEPQNFSVQVTPGSSVAAKDKAADIENTKAKLSSESVTDVEKNSKENNIKEKSAACDPKSNPESAYKLTIPSSEGNDLMQGLMVDDELKDAEFLPPIVSLDEFMESLDSEPPFEDISKDADGSASDKDTDGGSESKSPGATQEPSVGTASGELKNLGVSELKRDSAVKSHEGSSKTLAATLSQIKGERIWDGLLQLNISVIAHVTGVFRSGEKTSAKEWPCLVEVKGRVKLEAFGKFLQELPLSRSRAVMVVHLVCRTGTSESDLTSLREVADSYVADGRVGLAEPSPGVELYVCPSHGKTSDILNSVFPRPQEAADGVDPLDSGLIGVVVWRKVTSISPKSAANHKHNSKRQHIASRRPQDKDTSSSTVIAAKSKHSSSSRSASQPKPLKPQQPPPVEADDDVPPGFGPQDEDDLPEFNFSAAERLPVAAPAVRRPQVEPQSLLAARPVDVIRQLIHKYGQPRNKSRQVDWRESKGSGLPVQPWNDEDDDDDMPEWRPDDTSQRQFLPAQSLYNQHPSLARQLVGHSLGQPTVTHAPTSQQPLAFQQKSNWSSTHPHGVPPGYGGLQWPASDSRGS